MLLVEATRACGAEAGAELLRVVLMGGDLAVTLERITRLIRKSFGNEVLMLEGWIEFKRRHCSKNPTD